MTIWCPNIWHHHVDLVGSMLDSAGHQHWHAIWIVIISIHIWPPCIHNFYLPNLHNFALFKTTICNWYFFFFWNSLAHVAVLLAQFHQTMLSPGHSSLVYITPAICLWNQRLVVKCNQPTYVVDWISYILIMIIASWCNKLPIHQPCWPTVDPLI